MQANEAVGNRNYRLMGTPLPHSKYSFKKIQYLQRSYIASDNFTESGKLI